VFLYHYKRTTVQRRLLDLRESDGPSASCYQKRRSKSGCNPASQGGGPTGQVYWQGKPNEEAGKEKTTGRGMRHTHTDGVMAVHVSNAGDAHGGPDETLSHGKPGKGNDRHGRRAGCHRHDLSGSTRPAR